MTHEPDSADPPAGDDVLAGEYALGLLSGEELEQVEARFRSDAIFAARVNQWHLRLAGLTGEIEPAGPPAGAWPEIQRKLFADMASEASERPGFWSSLGLWRGLSAAFLGVAAGSFAFALFLAEPRTPGPLVASLQATDAGPSYLARMDPATGRLLIRAVQADTDQNRVPELWLIPGDGVARSLGVIGREGPSEVVIPDNYRQFIGAGATLAISLEPPGGSPTGQATGPVIAVGKVGEL
ncbi:MAG: anti-sigma factor [Parvibaculaceae bacterium]